MGRSILLVVAAALLCSCGADFIEPNPPRLLRKHIDYGATCAGTVLPRVQTRFAFFATPETVSTSDMRASCLSVPGIPLQSIDVLEASAVAFFDPLANKMNVAQPGLASRFDLCESFGTGASAQLTSFANAWGQLLSAQP